MKPIISSFMFFDDSQHIPNSGAPGMSMHLINPQNTIKTPFIPSSFSFAVAFGIVSIDTEQSHVLSFQLIDPEGNFVVDTSEIQLNAEPGNNDNIPIEARGYNFNLNLRNVQLQYKGKYTGRVTVDHEIIGEFPLFVYPVNN
ncbi:hypothetical protein [Lysinibacillus sp. RC79]|uniref:DUF6941 family protein n=1 Tax=Lysinibacillus sp. RC79 TaxID=3156296 RepID=UPI0035194D18